ncbi:MAG: hypothetical protein O7B35_18475 [Deltaproteobacteria bacterium]|nr:hypothetical protein [Deltaproteobacteria bacterium]
MARRGDAIHLQWRTYACSPPATPNYEEPSHDTQSLLRAVFI